MKTKAIIFLFTASLVLSLCAKGQQVYDNISVSDVIAEQQDSLLTVEMRINGSRTNLPSNQALILTPVIKSADRLKELQPIVIKGSNRYKADKRAKTFDDARVVVDNPFVSLTKDQSRNINYTQTLLFEDWMVGASLEMKEQVYGCVDCKGVEKWNALLDPIVAQQPVVRPTIKYLVTFIAPKAEAVKSRDNQGTAYLEFPVGKSVIVSDFRNNFRELSKINDAINQLRDNKNATITSISLKGFASPEGPYKTNSALSESRAQALKNYLQTEFSYPSSLFTVSSIAEDWDGLKTLVENSDITNKASVLDIINSSDGDDVKEQKLKALGSTYNTLLTDFFPKLRRVDYKVNYTIRPFSVDEGKEIVKVSPAQMSLNEMFLVANTYEKGSDEFNNVFDIAVRIFPLDVTANLNAAAIVLDKNDTAAAHRYLDKYEDVSDSWNNQGILYALEGNIEKAKEYFLKAQATGSVEATQNLEKIKELEEYNAASTK
ncbi:DUF3868 domain-containing protein [Dysgonomonas sp. ZJ709]|uniref:DUF3868 domain-containing protein n=1 Tax=Dysgonomonas sp. ZJ709 TaxID=2709797 RepID=UPI0013ED42E2|nr:DUF3868 domain-containing protein [Dysgonomonas sp. ZJ709]